MENVSRKAFKKTDKSGNKPVIGQKNIKSGRLFRLFKIVCGLLCGAVNGFFGGGGGMIVVPMLEKFLGYKEKNAHATAIAIILPISILSGALSFAGFGAGAGVLIPVSIGSVLGGAIGALCIKKMPPKAIAYLFCLVMAFAGGKLAFF